MIILFCAAGDENRNVLQSSDNRKKVSFQWNSRTLPAGCHVVASKSVEQQLTEAADVSKLVPYEDDDSETEKEFADTTSSTCITTENTNVCDGGCVENTDSFANISVTNSENDEIVSGNNLEIVTSTDNHVRGCNDRLSSCDDNNGGAYILSESSSYLMPMPVIESTAAEKETGPLLSSTTEDGLAKLADSAVVCATEPAAENSTGYQLNNAQLPNGSDLVTGRKRHARHKSRRHHTKHRRHYPTQSSASAWYSSDDEVEYVWVEKTAETIARHLTGKCPL